MLQFLRGILSSIGIAYGDPSAKKIRKHDKVLSSFRCFKDRIGGVTFYKHRKAPVYPFSRSTVYLVIGVLDDSKSPFLKTVVQYSDRDWLRANKVTAWFDGSSTVLVSGDFKLDFSPPDYWETIEEPTTEAQFNTLLSLSTAREAILRFNGDTRISDVHLSSADKRALGETLYAFEAMREGAKYQ